MAHRPATCPRRHVKRGSSFTPISHPIARPETTSTRPNQEGEKGGFLAQGMNERYRSPLQGSRNLIRREPRGDLHSRVIIASPLVGMMGQKRTPFYTRNWSDVTFKHFCRAWRYERLLRDDRRWRTKSDCRADWRRSKLENELAAVPDLL